MQEPAPDDDDDAGGPQPDSTQGSAPQPACHHCISATLQLQIAANVSMTEAQKKKVKKDVCVSALTELNTSVFKAGNLTNWLLWAVCSLEFGKTLGGAHLQFGGMFVSAEVANKVLLTFKKTMREVLSKHVAADSANPKGVVTWALRKVHIHTDPKYLMGYCWKEHLRYATIALFPHAIFGVSHQQLQAAYSQYKTARSSSNEGGAGTLNLLRPGQSVETSTMTRTSVLPDVEYFEHMQGLIPLGLSVGKLAASMISSDHAQLHPMFASGASASAGPDPVLQNVYHLLRKRPRLADGAGVHLVNKLLYADPKYDADRDLEVSRAMGDLKPGPKFEVTNGLTYSECILSVRTGTLPNGTRLDGELEDRFVGKGLVLSLSGGEAQAAARDCATIMDLGTLRVVKHISDLGMASQSLFLAALAARMLTSFEDPFTLSFSDFVMRLSSPQVMELVREMIESEGADDDVHAPLSQEDVATIISGVPPEGAAAEHAWLLKLPRTDVDIEDATVGQSDFSAMLKTSLDAYEAGVPQLHVRIIQASTGASWSGGNPRSSQGSFFVCAWQLSLAHMHRLEGRRSTTQGTSQGSSSASGGSTSSSTLMSLLQGGQAALANS